VNRDLEAKARTLAGLKGYTTNLANVSAEFIIDAYHQLWRIEKSFRMSKHDLRSALSTTTNASRSRPT
jgi:IS4 transposase